MTLAAKGFNAFRTLLKRGNDSEFAVTPLTANATLRLTENGIITLNKATTLALVLQIPKAGIWFGIHHQGGVGIAHTVTLPSGMLWTATAGQDVATLDAVDESIFCFVLSPTRIWVAVNNGAVAFS